MIISSRTVIDSESVRVKSNHSEVLINEATSIGPVHLEISHPCNIESYGVIALVS